MDVEKSVEKKRLIYNIRFWDKFWALLVPVFIGTLLLCSSFFVFENNYDKTYKENYWFILIGSISFFVFIIIFIIFYFKIDNLTEFRGKSKAFNKKMILLFAEEYGHEITHQTNSRIFIDIKVKYFGFSNKRRLSIIFNGISLFYNCTTFVNATNSQVYIKNFKSPFYWFANKNHEKIFRKFLKENSYE